MGTENKFQTSNIAVCLKAIKDYIDADLTSVAKDEQDQLKKRAKNAVDHLTLLFNPEVKNLMLYLCPSGTLPTID
jgi:hypothetical protein